MLSEELLEDGLFILLGEGLGPFEGNDDGGVGDELVVD